MVDSKIPETVKSLLDIYQSPFVLVDRNYNIVAANGAYCKQYHTEPDAIVGKKCHSVSHSSNRPCHEHGEDCPHQRMFASGKMEESIHIHHHAGGITECVEICAYPVKGADGDILYMGEQLTPIEPRQILAEESMIGDSPIFLEAVHEAKLLASVQSPILITGESGSGKEGFSHYIHSQNNAGHAKPLVIVDCCSLHEKTFEAVLFGQDAASSEDGTVKIGLIEKAHQGALVFDEIGELSLAMQSKLLRVVETGQYRRMGSSTTLHSAIRIISTTNKHLHSLVDAGQFRSDFYFRIAGHTLEIPPLRKRKQDIIQLCCYFLNQSGKEIAPSKRTMEILKRYPYPGNVRELKSILEMATLKSADATSLEPRHLPDYIRYWKPNSGVKQPKIDQFFEESQKVRPDITDDKLSPIENNFDRYTLGIDREYVLAVLKHFEGSRRKTAISLGITERKLYRLLKRYRDSGIDVPERPSKKHHQNR